MATLRLKRESVLGNWADVDTALCEMGELQNLITEIEVELNRQLTVATKEAEAKALPHQERISELKSEIKKFATAHKKELDGKSKKLNHGETGFRKSTSCVIPKGKEPSIILMLKKLSLLDCIDIKESINRNVLKTYPDEVVEKTGARLKTTDSFWQETSYEKLKNSKEQ